jgi:signal transduction histidine kinase
MNYRFFIVIFFVLGTLQLSSQNSVKNLTVDELPKTFFGVWLDDNDNVTLITTPEYLVYNDRVCYYYNILAPVSNPNTEHTVFRITYFDEDEYGELNLFLQADNRLYLDRLGALLYLNKKELAIPNEALKILRSKWYNLTDVISINADAVKVNSTSYVIDYIVMQSLDFYIVGYNDSRYKLFKIERNTDGEYLYFNGKRYTKETFFQKYSIQLIVLIIILSGFLVYLLFKWKVAISKKKADAKHKLAEMQLKSIRSQMNPHFVFNALSAIQHLINKNDNDRANHYLTEFSQLMRLTLDKSQKGLVPLSDEIASIKKYLDLENLRFQFDYSIQTDPEIDVHHTEIPAMLIQPFVENAIIHGLNGIKGEKKLILQFKKLNKYLQCTIQDNGIGIKASKQNKGVAVKKEHYGHKLAEDRIRLINESHNTHAKITVTDLSDISQNQTGTLIEILTPLNY